MALTIEFRRSKEKAAFQRLVRLAGHLATFWNCPCRESSLRRALNGPPHIGVAGEERDDVRAGKYWRFPVFDGLTPYGPATLRRPNQPQC
ncbi:MAG: hypothetical protein ABJF50_23220 [Paracoccaceae bacterium]